MIDPDLRLTRAPIIEAVLDIDCDLPPAQAITALEAPAREVFCDAYPIYRPQWLHQATIEPVGDGPPRVTTPPAGLQAHQFLQADERQIVQVRAQGFSFNRLAPYTSLDEYLPEIERTWQLFVAVAAPIQVKVIRLRYINRIVLPIMNGRVDLDDYLRNGPRLPDEDRLSFTGFLDQHEAVERATGNRINVIMANQELIQGQMPLIFDITAFREEATDPGDWGAILAQVQSLRTLKNRVFRDSLTDLCLEMFR